MREIPHVEGRPGLRVVHPGAFTTIQDRGRFGYREWGVSPGGVFDLASADLSNALVGNTSDHAVLEMTLFGGTFEALVPLALALAGVPMSAAIIGTDGNSRPITFPSAFTLQPAERLSLGGTRVGLRTYLAVKGGWDTPLVLGSRSCETRLEAGQVLSAEAGTTLIRHPAEASAVGVSQSPIRVIDGLDASRVEESNFWSRWTFGVGAKSNRMGLRLRSEPLPVAPDENRLSTPVAPGAIQVAGGQALVLGVACGTMGGYPLIAHVIAADLDRIGQARPDVLLRFERISLAEARRVDEADQRARRERFRIIATIAAER